MTHAPDSLRDAFDTWVTRGRTPVGHGLAWLLLQLWHCTDPLPHDVGVWLDLPPGSTYGDAAREASRRRRAARRGPGESETNLRGD